MLYLNIMINFNTNKQLGIILPNTNRALAEVLKNISPQEFETLSKSKDIKSILDSLLKDSIQNSKSDKLLLELMKNNPTLKKIGNVSNTIKDLIASLKSDKNSLPIAKILKDFLVDIKELNEPILKDKIVNSGVFMESKVKYVKNPQVEVKSILELLSKSIQKSEIPITKELNQLITKVLSQKILKEASNEALMQLPKIELKDLKQLSSDIKTIITKIEVLINSLNSEITNKSETISPLNRELLDKDKVISPRNSEVLDKDKVISPRNREVLDKDEVISPRNREVLNKAEFIFSKEVISIARKLSFFTTPQKLMPDAQIKELLSTDLKSILIQLSDEVVKSSHPNHNEIVKHADKLLLQIDYHQIISHLSNSTSLYIPFSWDQMEDGNINIKQSDDNKFYCDIELTLKEYGELRIRLALYDENQLNIYLYSKDDNFRSIIKENIDELRSLLINADINPRDIRIFDKESKNVPKPYKSYTDDIDMGFDIKV